MPSESPVARFLRWRWAPSVLLVTGALAFALAAATLIPKNTRSPSTRSPSTRLVEPRSPSPRSPEPHPIAADRAAPDRADARRDPTVEGLFPSTPVLELPLPLEEPEPPPEPQPAPVPTEMSVPESDAAL